MGNLEVPWFLHQPTVLTLLARSCPCLNSLAYWQQLLLDTFPGRRAGTGTCVPGGAGAAFVRSSVRSLLTEGRPSFEQCDDEVWEWTGGAGGFRKFLECGGESFNIRQRVEFMPSASWRRRLPRSLVRSSYLHGNQPNDAV